MPTFSITERKEQNVGKAYISLDWLRYWIHSILISHLVTRSSGLKYIIPDYSQILDAQTWSKPQIYTEWVLGTGITPNSPEVYFNLTLILIILLYNNEQLFTEVEVNSGRYLQTREAAR